MSQRERWMVYPLLFLALGVSLRDKLIPPQVRALSVESISVRCAQLEVRDRVEVCDRSGRTLIVIGPDETGRRYGLYARVPGRQHLAPLSLYAMPDLSPEAAEPSEEDGQSQREGKSRSLEP